MTRPTLDEIKWTCPHCGAKNVDYKELTAIPLCSGCDRDVHWDEIEKADPFKGYHGPSADDGTKINPKPPHMSVDRNFQVTIHEGDDNGIPTDR